MKKFRCAGCGNCCRFLGEKTNEKIPCFIDGGPIIVLSEPKLVIKDWEKHLFPEKNVVPYSVLFDLKESRTIVLNYTLNVERCPCLDGEGMCRIYNRRPIGCRSFPYLHLSVHNNKLNSSYGSCKGELPLKELYELFGFEKEGNKLRIKDDIFSEKLYQRYGESHIYNVIDRNLQQFIAKTILQLERKGACSLARKDKNSASLFKKIKTSEKVDVSDFIKEHTKFECEKAFSRKSLEKVRKIFG